MSAWWHSCGMESVAHGTRWLAPEERERIARMRYTKRRSESLLGRWTAKYAIASVLGIADDADEERLASITVRNARDGAPEVYLDGRAVELGIAMSDRADWAVTAVRPGTQRIGCDLELVEPRSAEFVRDYFTPAEQALVAGGDAAVLANLIWSAKESALKVLRTGLRRDTRSVEVALGTGDGRDWSELTVTVDGRAVQYGWWIRYGDFVLTFAAELALDAPRSLVEPPALAGATPGHAWMSDPAAGPLT
jgi:4'-phosphopantetheinyl transferase